MSKQIVSTLNYQTVFIHTLKEKFNSFLLGFFIILIVGTFFVLYISKQMIPEKTRVVPKSTVAKSPVVTIKPKTYVVQEGDGFWQIAEKMYGSGFNYVDIEQANHLTDSDALNVGQQLVIPDVKPRQPTVGDIDSAASTQR